MEVLGVLLYFLTDGYQKVDEAGVLLLNILPLLIFLKMFCQVWWIGKVCSSGRIFNRYIIDV